MTCKSIEPELLMAWVDGELELDAARQVASHVAICPNCYEAAEGLRTETDALRQALGRDGVPTKLWAQITAQMPAEIVPAMPTTLFGGMLARISKPVLGAALAASIMIAVLATTGAVSVRGTPEYTLATIASETTQDYVTFRESQLVLDVASDDPAETLSWLDDRIDGAFPQIADNVLDYRLIGGRLCLLLGQRLGALTYADGSDQITVYVMMAPTAASSDDRQRGTEQTARYMENGVSSIVWSEDGLAIAIVSTLPDAEKARFAEALSKSLNMRFSQT